MEELELTDPVVTTTSKYKMKMLSMDMELLGGHVSLELRDNHGGLFRHEYRGQEAVDMIKWLNTANFSVNSMNKRILQKLSVDGVLPGTVVGEPDA